MNWILAESNWAQFRGTVKARWLKFDDERLCALRTACCRFFFRFFSFLLLVFATLRDREERCRHIYLSNDD
ncbi:hypothetical protein [Steroidobacter cummioxidans]|uniref:hypothetical protein n=1 Tax=Steroidobacter cummioxidans TaxID=1803913 RepID=UPI000E3107EB|nr:hypothetical protein [Steroidobacter cummioxidans]